MTRRWTLFALSQVIAEGTRDAAIRSLKGCDPLIRPWVKKRAVVALRRAEQESGSEDPAHLGRLASFLVAGRPYASSFDDVAGLAREYEEAFQASRPRTGPRLSLGLGGGIGVVAVAALVLFFRLRAFEPSQTPTGKLFESSFTKLAVAAAKGDREGARRSVAEFSAAKLPWSKDIHSLSEAALAVRAKPDAEGAYYAAAVTLNKTLVSANAPYYVDAEVFPLNGVASPILTSFYVQERGTYEGGGNKTTVLRLWRLDHLNVVESKLGYTRPAIPFAVVLLDQVENDLVTQILPAVADGEMMSLTDEDTTYSQEEWVAEVQEKGGEIIRKHFASAPPALTEKARQLGALLARRRALLTKWTRALGLESGVLRMPRRLVPEADYAEDLHLRVSSAELREWDSLHSDLLDSSSLSDFEEVREAYALSVERHEVQHRLDYATERLEIPEMLAHRMGGIETMGHRLHSHPMKAAAELSAYLSQIADDPAPRLAIVSMSRQFLNKYSMQSAHGFAGVVALEAMAKHLGISPEGALGRVATRPELARLMALVCQEKMSDVRQAARSAYRELFGEDLPRVERRLFERYPRWRH